MILLEAIAVTFGNLTRPPWGDESHFVETVRLFASHPTLETLRSYPEMSGPLPFALFALWGTLAGFELWVLRLLSLLIALCSYLLFHRLLWRLFGHGLAAFLLTAFLAIQPYMVGFSIFVFTDGPTILLLLLAFLGALSRRMSVLLIGLAGALLCRQYAAFFVLALFAWASLLIRCAPERTFGLRLSLTAGLATLPLLALFAFWEGFSPDSHLRSLYMGLALAFHPSYMFMYVSLLSYYLLPLLVFVRRQLYGELWLIFSALALSQLYWLFPVEASPYARAIGVETVGLLHKALVRVSDHPWFAQGVFYFGLLFGLPIVLQIGRSASGRIRNHPASPLLLLDLTVLAFLLVMPLSYLNWEKYLMPLLPFALARLAALRLPLAGGALPVEP